MRLDGAVESAIKLGVADVIADVVETGTTLRAAGLEIFADPILRSEAVLVRRSDGEEPAGLDVLTRRLQGVLTAREYVLMDYDVPLDLVDRAVAITPGPRVADRVAAAQPRLGGRAGDGPARPDQPGHGLPVRHRCARDPRDVDPRVPALSGPPWTTSTAPFRPRFARVVTLVMAVVVVALTVAIMLALSVLTAGDRLGFAIVGGLIALFLWRQASVVARVDDDGLTVRNLVFTRRLEWAEIVSVRFGSGRPWVQLDLADGDTLAVMGIQRADGAFADAEARRLATLVALHTTTPRDD